MCNLGQLGDGCESDASCDKALSCAVIIDAPGILSVSTCSECVSDAACDGGDSCQPDYDIANLTGVLECVPDDSLADGHGCDPANGGAAACDSGHCVPATFMGILSVGVCSECTDDGDCGGALTCDAPEINPVTGLIAGQCV